MVLFHGGEGRRSKLESSIVDEREILHSSLRERTKEIACLYEISTVLIDGDVSLSDAIVRIAEVVPHGFSRPERTQVEISYLSSTHRSGPHGQPRHSLREPLHVGGKAAGYLLVGVLDEPNGTAASVLTEETRLLRGIADLSGAVIERIERERSLAEFARNLQDKNTALREILFQVETEKERHVHSLLGIAEERLRGRHGRRFLNDLKQEMESLSLSSGTRDRRHVTTLSSREYEVCQGYHRVENLPDTYLLFSRCTLAGFGV